MKKSFVSLILLAMMSTSLVSCGGTESTTVPVTTAPIESTSSKEESKDLVISGTSSIIIGGTSQLDVKVGTAYLPVGVTVTWTSSDETIATVSSAGLVTGVAVGSVTITAAAEGYTSATYTVTVTTNTQAFKVAITPKFATGSGDQAVKEGWTLFFASTLDNWTNHELTLDTSTNTYIYSLDAVEFDQTIQYNVHYAKKDSDGWTYKNTESVDNQPRTLEIAKGTLSYDIDATFNVPSVLESLKFVFTVSLRDGTLSENAYLWYASQSNSWTPTLCTKQADGTWTYTDTNVSIQSGEGKSWAYKVMLGSQTDCFGWKYALPSTGNYYPDITADMTEYEQSLEFTSQPNLDVTYYQASFTVNCSDALEESSGSVGNMNIKADDGDKWQALTKTSDGVYTGTVSFSAGTHTFVIYQWTSELGDDHIFGSDANKTPFEINITADTSYVVTGTFASGGTLTIA